MNTESPLETARYLVAHAANHDPVLLLMYTSPSRVLAMARALVETDKVLREKINEGVGRERRLETQSPGRFLRAVVSPTAHLTVAEQAIAAILDGTTEGEGT